jgi:hypothetical protein
VEMRKMESHKIVGIVLLLIGLIIALIPLIFVLSTPFRGGSVPTLLQTPVLSNITVSTIKSSLSNVTISTSSLNKMVKAVFPVVNLVLLLVLSLFLIYAGGVIMGKGVGLIKEIKLKAVRKAVREVSEEIEVIKKEKAEKTEKKPKHTP